MLALVLCTTGLGLSQIEGEQTIAAAAAGGDQLHFRRHLLAQGLAQLAGSAGEQDFHANTSPMC
jgi:hypothetical protein